MSAITNFAEAQARLRPFYNNAQTPYTLDAMRELMRFLGNPQETLQVVHVAGTSGKTSTAYYCAALLQQSGHSIGLTVSPHIDAVNERLQINGQPLSEATFCAVLDEFLTLISDCPVRPSYFELLTAMAFWEFARRGLDYAVMEVGLGGLLDATNVIANPHKLCVITDIGLDHTEILGDTLPLITTQKAGIIQTGNAVFMYRQPNEVIEVVQKMADQKKAQLTIIENSCAEQIDGLPVFQQRNLGLAVAVIRYALQRDGRALSQSIVHEASRVVVPARLERRIIGDKTLVLDGSHNQQKTQALLTSLDELYSGTQPAVLCAFMAGKINDRWQQALQLLSRQAATLLFTTFHSEQDYPKSSVTLQEIVEFCEKEGITNYRTIDNPSEAYRALLEQPQQLLLITGSFYLLNHIRPLLP